MPPWIQPVHPSWGPFASGSSKVDLRAGELRKQGVKVKLQEQPFQVLQVLLERPGEVVTREELRQKIWPSDTFVDFEGGVYNAVKRLRDALGDTADTPRFVETIPRRGYRFIGTVNGDLRVDSQTAEMPGRQAIPPRRDWAQYGAGALAVLVVVGILYWLNVRFMREPEQGIPKIQSIAVLPFPSLSDDVKQGYFAQGFTDALITALARIHALRVTSRTSVLQLTASSADDPSYPGLFALKKSRSLTAHSRNRPLRMFRHDDGRSDHLAKISALRVISRTTAMHYKGVHRPVPEIARELPTSPVILVPADALVMPEPASNPKLVADPRSIVVPLDLAKALDATSRAKTKLVREFIFSIFTLPGEHLFVAAANPSKEECAGCVHYCSLLDLSRFEKSHFCTGSYRNIADLPKLDERGCLLLRYLGLVGRALRRFPFGGFEWASASPICLHPHSVKGFTSMTFLKLVLAAIVTVATLFFVVTYLYIVGLTRAPKGVRGAIGIDVAILPRVTIYSLTYWLIVVLVLALLWWFLWRWLFAG